MKSQATEEKKKGKAGTQDTQMATSKLDLSNHKSEGS
jgi:hypothetical protein